MNAQDVRNEIKNPNSGSHKLYDTLIKGGLPASRALELVTQQSASAEAERLRTLNITYPPNAEAYDPCKDCTYFKTATRKLLSGKIEPELKKIVVSKFVEELCEVGKNVEFIFSSLCKLKIRAGYLSYFKLVDVLEKHGLPVNVDNTIEKDSFVIMYGES